MTDDPKEWMADEGMEPAPPDAVLKDDPEPDDEPEPEYDEEHE